MECSSWANQSTTIGDGKPFDKYVYEESERMVETFGNHPSFCLMLYGNEPGGKNYTQFLTKFVTYWKNKDSRRIYTAGSGWPNVDENDYQSTPNPRIQAWGEELKSIINGSAPASDYDWNSKIASFKQPVVSHAPEFCFPNRLEAIVALEYAKEKNPSDAKAPYYLGNLWYDKRQYDEAIVNWEKSVSLDPAFPTACFWWNYRSCEIGFLCSGLCG